MGIIMFARLLLGACFAFSQLALAATSNPGRFSSIPQEQNRKVPGFIGIMVLGDVNLNLHTGYSKPRVILYGDPRDLNCVKIFIEEGELRILVARGYPKYGKISADIRTKYLSSMVYEGDGTIVGKNIRANLVNLKLKNNGRTTLNGQIILGRVEALGNGYTEIDGVTSPMLHVKLSDDAKLKLKGEGNLRKVEMDGNSWFSFVLVRSTSLIVRLCGNAFLQLAGIVNKMDAKLDDHALLNARYLRVRRAFVKTHGYSVAEISALEHQHTLASDSSDIRFYNLPDTKTDFMAFDGSVLDMRALNSPFVEEPTIYNKGVPKG